MSNFDRCDFDFGLGEVIDEVRAQARRFARERIAPRAEEIDRSNEFPRDLWPELGSAGLLGVTVPERWGGANLGYLAHIVVMEEISRASGSVGLSYGAHSNLCMNQIALNATDAQRDRYLPRLVSGEHVGALAMSEPGAGSDVVGMQLRAEKRGESYALTGSKMWITNAPVADLALVWAKLDGVIRGFLLERGAKGFSTPKIEGKLSLRTSITGEIVLEDAFVPEENVLPNAKGLAGPFGCLNVARAGIAWGAIGAAEFCWHRARQYVLDRKQFGRPLAANQLIQKKLADMQTEIALGLHGALRLGRLLEQGRAAPPAVSLLKRNNCGKALEIARLARDMHGGNGVSDEFHVMRVLCNLETVNTYEGTHDIHALILGRAQTGIQAFF
jgi:glutaryl-CoA dehydrogenase